MHTHSKFSDGTYWPDELAAKAKTLGIELLCLTDHDTMSGTAEFLRAADSLKIRSWPAVEIDCVDSPTHYKSEILGYFPAGNYANTDAFLLENRKQRLKSVQVICARAQALFDKPELSFDSLVALKTAGRSGKHAIDPLAIRFAKTDIFTILRLHGIVPATLEYRDFKKAYFETGLFADIKFPKTSMADIISIIRSDGGYPVIPHIGHEFDDDFRTLEKGKDKLRSMLERYYSLGARGVELYFYRKEKTQAMNNLIEETAKSLGYFFTYGSDCHGPKSGKETLGLFSGDFDDFPELDS